MLSEMTGRKRAAGIGLAWPITVSMVDSSSGAGTGDNARGGLADQLLTAVGFRDELALHALDGDAHPAVREGGIGDLADPVQFVGAGLDDHCACSTCLTGSLVILNVSHKTP